jgi:amino acid transporter
MAASDASKVGLVSDSGGQDTKKLQRVFSPFAMLGLAFAVLNPWVALSASLPLALPNGGPSAVIWGLVTSGVCHMCLALSLAEFLSAHPDAGGQYVRISKGSGSAEYVCDIG